MSWEGFWVPNLLSATLFAALSAVVGTAVGLIVRRWLRQWAAQLFGEQQRTTTAAETAASRAGEALDASHKAVQRAEDTSTDARAAADNSRQANAAIEWLAQQLATRDAVNEDLKERIDRLLGTRARALATEREDDTVPPALLIPLSAGDDSDPASVTGRHRLHLQHVPAADEGDDGV